MKIEIPENATAEGVPIERSRMKRLLPKRQHSKVMRKLMRYVDEQAKDHAGYAGRFLKIWETVAFNVNGLADEVAHGPERFPNDLIREITFPYSIECLTGYARLMDHLDPDEEARFLVIERNLAAAWQKFICFAQGRHPEAVEAFQTLQAAQQTVHEEVVRLFLGEMPARFTPAWIRASDQLNLSFKIIQDVWNHG